jgi:hypothetical protein
MFGGKRRTSVGSSVKEIVVGEVEGTSSIPGVILSVQDAGEVKGGCGLAETVSLGAGVEVYNNGIPGTALTSASYCRPATLPDGGAKCG